MKNVLYMALAALAGCSYARNDALNTVIVTGVITGAVIEESRNPRPMPGLSAFDPWLRTPEPAPLAADRRVSEQDCTRPIDYTLGNLRCK